MFILLNYVAMFSSKYPCHNFMYASFVKVSPSLFCTIVTANALSKTFVSARAFKGCRQKV